MKKRLCHAAYWFLWLLTACVGVLELALAGLWWDMRCYLEQYGAEENPYAAEDTFMLGLFALFLLVPLFCLLAASLWGRHVRKGKLVKSEHEYKTADGR